MTFIIAEGCTKDASCVAVCPVDCISTTDESNQYFIDPEACIDCGACEPECPTGSIYTLDNVPSNQTKYIQINADFFRNN